MSSAQTDSSHSGFEAFAQEAVRVWRELARSPVFSATILLTLVLGIGPSSAVFELINGLLLKPLPYTGADRIVVVWQTATGDDGPREVVPANFRDWQQRSNSFESMAAFSTREVNLGGTENPERLMSNFVSAEFFPLLGAKAAHGRTLGKEDFGASQVQAAVISDGVWRRSFGGDPNAIGRKVLIDAMPYTIVGVMPPGFQLAEPADVWAPLVLTPEELADRSSDSLVALGKLKPGVAIAGAQSEMNTIAEQLAREYPETNKGSGILLINLREQLVGGLRVFLFTLAGAALVVLLIAAVNVVQLLLIRTEVRQRAVALRVAFGGRRADVLWPMIVESVTLSILGGICGLVLASQIIGLLVKVLPPFISNRDGLGLNLDVVLFTLALSILTGVLVALIPASRVFRVDLTKIFKETSTQGAAGRPALQKLLAVSEIALALLLLCTAGLLVRSFLELRQAKPGFRPDGLLVMKLVLPTESYPEDPQVIAFTQRLHDELANLRGVRSAGAVSQMPFGGSNSTRFFIVEGQPVPAEGERLEAYYRVVTPDYFRTLEIPLHAGPGFTAIDDTGAPPKVVVSQVLADQIWPGENAIGKRISTRIENPNWMEVVGVVGDVKHWGLDDPKTLFLYTAFAQRPTREMTWAIRFTGREADVAPGIRTLVRNLDPNLPVSLAPMASLMERSMTARRVSALLFAVMAIVAFLLGVVGLYSVMHYLTGRRRREIAIKLALGAQRSTVLMGTLRQGFWLVLIGLVIGLGAALAATQVIQSLLYGIDPLDMVTLIFAPLIVAVVGLLAVLVPARRTTQIEPLEILRYE